MAKQIWLFAAFVAAGLGGCGESGQTIEGKWCPIDPSAPAGMEMTIRNGEISQGTQVGSYTFDGKKIVMVSPDGANSNTFALDENGVLGLEGYESEVSFKRCP